MPTLTTDLATAMEDPVVQRFIADLREAATRAYQGGHPITAIAGGLMGYSVELGLANGASADHFHECLDAILQHLLNRAQA